MSKRKWNDEQFIEAVKSNLSYAGVLRELGLKPAGSNYDTVKRKIKELNLDTSHMTGKAWNQGKRFTPVKVAKSLKEILVKDSTCFEHSEGNFWCECGLIRRRCEHDTITPS